MTDAQNTTAADQDPAYWVVIPAAGCGNRMGTSLPKQYLELAGRTVIEHTLALFSDHPLVAGIVVALPPNDAEWTRLAPPTACPLHTVTGGADRHLSVLNALRRLSVLGRPHDWVLVHDAARPCLRRADLDRLIAMLQDHPVGGLLGVPVSDTLKRVDTRSDVVETLERNGVWRALTPQMFRLGALRSALEAAVAGGRAVTDEAGAMEHAGHAVRMVEGHADNIKITAPGDLALAEIFLRRHQEERE
ncbi:MAG: 2-C-methyl-D-erythritol 4-phosphate cytidylyltransferase [Gammaproteobacteria bacterium]